MRFHTWLYVGKVHIPANPTDERQPRGRVCGCQVPVQCCFASTVTIRTIRDGEPRTATSIFTQLLLWSACLSCFSFFFFFFNRDRLCVCGGGGGVIFLAHQLGQSYKQAWRSLAWETPDQHTALAFINSAWTKRSELYWTKPAWLPFGKPRPPFKSPELRHFQGHCSGAVWESRWTSWAVRPNEPSGFRGRKELLNRASALVTTSP